MRNPLHRLLQWHRWRRKAPRTVPGGLIGDWLPDYGWSVLCPECGWAFCHPSAVRVNRGGDITEITAIGTVKRRGPAERRGVHIRLEMFCEEGHSFTLLLYFHKGSTHVRVEETARLPKNHEKWPRNIWRD